MHPIWISLAEAAGRSLSSQQHAQFEGYLDLLEQANQRMNLTRITDRAAAQVQHVGDALTLLPFLPEGEFSLVDVGSGGGVPGIPLAIARPEARVTLVEATKKKAQFLAETAAALGLVNATVLAERAEDVARGAWRESFDVSTARAVAGLSWLAEWCLPLVKVGGVLLASKGARVEAELAGGAATARRLGGSEPAVHPVTLPGAEHHVIVQIRKVARSDERYPRAASVAKGKALDT